MSLPWMKKKIVLTGKWMDLQTNEIKTPKVLKITQKIKHYVIRNYWNKIFLKSYSRENIDLEHKRQVK